MAKSTMSEKVQWKTTTRVARMTRTKLGKDATIPNEVFTSSFSQYIAVENCRVRHQDDKVYAACQVISVASAVAAHKGFTTKDTEL